MIVVTLACCYAACWGPTKRDGVEDVLARAQYLQHLGPDGRYYDLEGSFPSYDAPTAAAPLFVNVRRYTNGLVDPNGNPLSPPESVAKEHYFWFFGYVAKLPYERELD